MAQRDREIRHIVQGELAEYIDENAERIVDQLEEELRFDSERKAASVEITNIANILRAWSQGKPGKQ